MIYPVQRAKKIGDAEIKPGRKASDGFLSAMEIKNGASAIHARKKKLKVGKQNMRRAPESIDGP